MLQSDLPNFPEDARWSAEPPRHPDHAAVFADLDPELQGLVRSSPDSLLEGDGFEPSVPRSPVSSVGAACRFNGGRDAVEAHRPGGQII